MQLILIFESAATYNNARQGAPFDVYRIHPSSYLHPTQSGPATLHALPVDPGHARQRRLQPAGPGRRTCTGPGTAHGRLPLRDQPAAAGLGAERLHRGDRLADRPVRRTGPGRRFAGCARFAVAGKGPAAPARRHRSELPQARQQQRGHRAHPVPGHRPATGDRQRHPQRPGRQPGAKHRVGTDP